MTIACNRAPRHSLGGRTDDSAHIGGRLAYRILFRAVGNGPVPSSLRPSEAAAAAASLQQQQQQYPQGPAASMAPSMSRLSLADASTNLPPKCGANTRAPCLA